MPYLQPDWSQPKLTIEDARAMCQKIKLTPMDVRSDAIDRVLNSLRKSHANGGAFLVAVGIAEDPIFDRFASRNWLLQHQVLGRLLHREEIGKSFPELAIPSVVDSLGSPDESLTSLTDGFVKESSYIFLGKLAWGLHEGGAYSKPSGDGSEAADLAVNFCDALFQNRYAEVECFTNHHPWTQWFYGINWDWTTILIDLRKRVMWVLVMTDTD